MTSNDHCSDHWTDHCIDHCIDHCLTTTRLCNHWTMASGVWWNDGRYISSANMVAFALRRGKFIRASRSNFCLVHMWRTSSTSSCLNGRKRFNDVLCMSAFALVLKTSRFLAIWPIVVRWLPNCFAICVKLGFNPLFSCFFDVVNDASHVDLGLCVGVEMSWWNNWKLYSSS